MLRWDFIIFNAFILYIPNSLHDSPCSGKESGIQPKMISKENLVSPIHTCNMSSRCSFWCQVWSWQLIRESKQVFSGELVHPAVLRLAIVVVINRVAGDGGRLSWVDWACGHWRGGNHAFLTPWQIGGTYRQIVSRNSCHLANGVLCVVVWGRSIRSCGVARFIRRGHIWRTMIVMMTVGDETAEKLLKDSFDETHVEKMVCGMMEEGRWWMGSWYR